MEIKSQLAIRNLSSENIRRNDREPSGNNTFDNVLAKVSVQTQKDTKNDVKRVDNDTKNDTNNVNKTEGEKNTDKVQKDNNESTKVKENEDRSKDTAKVESKDDNNQKDKLIDSAKDKGVISEKIAQVLKDNKDDFSLEELMAALSAISSGKIDLNNLVKAEVPKEQINEIITEVKDVIEEAYAKFNNGELPQIKNKADFTDYLKEKISSVIKDKAPESLKAQIPELLKGLEEIPEENYSNPNVIKEQVTSLVSKKLNKNDDIISAIKQKLQEVQGVKINDEAVIKPVESNSSKSSDTEGFSMKKETKNSDDNFLKSLVSDDKSDTKINKATVFMNHMNNINNIKDDNMVAATDKVVINKETFTADIIKSVKFMALNNMKELTVKIMPKELGEVIIKVNMEGGAMKASVTASNKEAYNILNSNLQDITSKLENTDIKIQNFTIDIYNGDTTFFKENSKNNSGENDKKNNDKNKKIDSIDGEELGPENYSRIENSIDMLG